jgi:hypothetical protein
VRWYIHPAAVQNVVLFCRGLLLEPRRWPEVHLAGGIFSVRMKERCLLLSYAYVCKVEFNRRGN